MSIPLFPHQHQAAMRIAEGQPTYLGFDMGIGKTRTFIEAVQLRKAKRVLILCPASAVLVWRRIWPVCSTAARPSTTAPTRRKPRGSPPPRPC